MKLIEEKIKEMVSDSKEVVNVEGVIINDFINTYDTSDFITFCCYCGEVNVALLSLLNTIAPFVIFVPEVLDELSSLIAIHNSNISKFKDYISCLDENDPRKSIAKKHLSFNTASMMSELCS